MSDSLECRLHIVDEHHIAISRPECRQKTQISPELSAGMRSREACHISGKRDVVFGVEYVESQYN